MLRTNNIINNINKLQKSMRNFWLGPSFNVETKAGPIKNQILYNDFVTPANPADSITEKEKYKTKCEKVLNDLAMENPDTVALIVSTSHMELLVEHDKGDWYFKPLPGHVCLLPVIVNEHNQGKLDTSNIISFSGAPAKYRKGNTAKLRITLQNLFPEKILYKLQEICLQKIGIHLNEAEPQPSQRTWPGYLEEDWKEILKRHYIKYYNIYKNNNNSELPMIICFIPIKAIWPNIEKMQKDLSELKNTLRLNEHSSETFNFIEYILCTGQKIENSNIPEDVNYQNCISSVKSAFGLGFSTSHSPSTQSGGYFSVLKHLANGDQNIDKIKEIYFPDYYRGKVIMWKHNKKMEATNQPKTVWEEKYEVDDNFLEKNKIYSPIRLTSKISI